MTASRAVIACIYRVLIDSAEPLTVRDIVHAVWPSNPRAYRTRATDVREALRILAGKGKAIRAGNAEAWSSRGGRQAVTWKAIR